ncbi:putative DNA-directed RNA polymerase [Babesia sp. Xinjiang]|uniref:putative DNA-directed RNA polymerase n=1 Tax=Babesia sp. Xinjiang TaxID=462227 RepID=UPI000A253B38|nr:putative DNA-directed RNA polymerase [Babesia sp. Xinjiang]ORM41057.1 putative DNA-directed RNA polymerase [Babesia sp. Xinjiang]
MGPSCRLYSTWLEANITRLLHGTATTPHRAARTFRHGLVPTFIQSGCNQVLESTRRSLYTDVTQDVTEHAEIQHIASDNPCQDQVELLRRVKKAVEIHGPKIICWLRTNRQAHIRDVDPSVVALLRNAERFAALHGLLLSDVPLENLERHLRSATNLRNLFSPSFIEEQKATLYRNKHLPLLKHPEEDSIDTGRHDSHIDGHGDASCHTEGDGERVECLGPNYVNYKRQVLIERQSFAEALETARVEASSLMELEKPSQLPALSQTCEQWVHDIAEFIKQDRLKNAESVLPSILDEQTLARATVNLALQLMCFPAYAHDSKGQRGGLLRRRPQQTAGNQVLLAHAAIRLGDEVGRMYARKLAETKTTEGSSDMGGKPENVKNIEPANRNQQSTSTTAQYGDSPRKIGEIFDLPNPISVGINALMASAFSLASKARVMSNTATGVMDPTPQLHSDGTLTDDQKQWNNKQSAAVGGYLLHALVESCYVQVDLTTALRQTNSFAEIDPSMLLPDLRNGGSEQRDAAKKRRNWLNKTVSRIRQSRFDAGKVEIAAFAHKVHRHGVKVYGVLEMRECCMIHLRDAVARGLVNLSCLPMVCEPKPWTSVSSGGLGLLKHYFIRTQCRPTFDVRVYDLSKVFRVVTAFGKVPWKVNGDVFHLLKTLWTTDALLPVRSFLPDKSLVDADPSTLTNVMERANALSECSLFERRLRVAEDFLAEPRIYFPQNIDFRGRMYPLSPHLNHMADDICRALLKFAEKRPLGERGFFWLKIHLANLYGIDKVPLSERVDWVDQNTGIIQQMVREPFSDISQSFWKRVESPFQFYATAVDYVAALKSGDPYSHMSDVPVHQDGSCNGLQHYAALGRDLKGGAAVNLTPNERPQDVYHQVLLEVIAKVRADYQCNPAAPSDSVYTRSRLAKLCLEHGILRRKIVKQTVMTICYGVTRTGAVSQIEARLKEVETIDSMGPKTVRQLAAYIAGKVLGSIKTVFAEAMGIKKWLDDISAAHNRLNVPVTWISPVGLPCEQPYCKAVTKVVRTPIQAINVAEHAPSVVDKRRQKLAFPPNFVHSLDASHLMLTAEVLFQRGLSFAAVHDSYWTHACDVDVMNVAIRNQFVAMYSEPILENLYQSCNKRLRGEVMIPPPPRRGQLDLDSVRQSVYFFH